MLSTKNYLDNDVEHVQGGDTLFEDDGHIDPLLRDSIIPFAKGNGDAHYDSADGAVNPVANGDDGLSFAAPEVLMWQDFSEAQSNDYFDLSGRPDTSYSSALLGSTAPGVVVEPQAPEKAPVGQNRMMGIGFYEQDKRD